jgi:thiol-disulfide isomerase/thioredoxin
MLKSHTFWIAAILLAIVPMFFIDITEHILSYKKEVREEIITLAYEGQNYTRDQKTQMLDKLLDENVTLNFLMYSKGFLAFVFLVSGIFLLIRVNKKLSIRWIGIIPVTLGIMVLAVLVKVQQPWLAGDSGKIHFVHAERPPQSLSELVKAANLNSKVFYVDFWGTSCGPCLHEFRHFTKPLKERFPNAQDVSYVYIANGMEYLWRKQIDKYEVEGYHIFLDDDDYNTLFRNAVANDTAVIYMPRYLITDGEGNVVVADAKRPSDAADLLHELTSVLNNASN